MALKRIEPNPDVKYRAWVDGVEVTKRACWVEGAESPGEIVYGNAELWAINEQGEPYYIQEFGGRWTPHIFVSGKIRWEYA